MIYFNACIQDWWGSAGFGGRRFDGVIPLFCVGLAAFVDYAGGLVRRHAAAAVTALLAAIAVWNLALMGAAQNGAVRIGETLAFDRAWASQARVVHGWFGNPFTYPASLVFALRNGVSPGELRPAVDEPLPRRSAAALRARGHRNARRRDGDDEWLIGDGWHAPEKDGAATFRWAASPATLRIPLDHAAPLRVQVRLHAFAYPGAPPQTLTLSPTAIGRLACAVRALPVARRTGRRSSARCDQECVARRGERAGAAVRLCAAPGGRRRRRRSAAAGRGGRLGAHISNSSQ